MYFVGSNGKPCDVGSCKLAENYKISLNRNLEYLIVNVDKRNNGTYHFSLCIREGSALSLFNIKENIFKVLSNLKDIIVKLDLKTISISYSDNIPLSSKRTFIWNLFQSRNSLYYNFSKNCNIGFSYVKFNALS